MISFSLVLQDLILAFLNLPSILLLLSEKELIGECKISEELVFLIFERLIGLDLAILLNSVLNWLPSGADHWIVIRQNTIWHTLSVLPYEEFTLELFFELFFELKRVQGCVDDVDSGFNPYFCSRRFLRICFRHVCRVSSLLEFKWTFNSFYFRSKDSYSSDRIIYLSIYRFNCPID